VDGRDDGSGFLFGYLVQTPEEYVDWAETYYDQPLALDAA